MKHRNSNTSRSSSNSNGSTSNDSPILESSIKIQKPNYNMLLKENRNDPKYKTELCKTFSEKGSCPYGSKCRFAHGKEELFQKKINCKLYKQKECNSFFTNFYCNYGSRCHFKHDERTLDDIKQFYYTTILNYLCIGISSKDILTMSIEKLIQYTATPICKQNNKSRFI